MSTDERQHIHRAELRYTCGERTTMKTVEGNDATIAAWLRTVADAIDPQPDTTVAHGPGHGGDGETL